MQNTYYAINVSASWMEQSPQFTHSFSLLGTAVTPSSGIHFLFNIHLLYVYINV